MRYRRLATLVAAAAFVACAEPPADEAPADEPQAMTDQEAIAALADAWEAAYNAHDAAAVAAMYTEESWMAPADGGMFEGREEIQAWAADGAAQSPTIDITPLETVVSGDLGMGIGRYTVTVPAEGGEAMSFSGAWINAVERVDGEWMIAGTTTNYDSPRPEGWEWNPAMDGEEPPENDMFPETTAAYEAAWNAGDGAGIAALYTDDAMASWTDGPILDGRAAIEAAAMDRSTSGTTLDLHAVGGMDMGAGWNGVGGWYEVADAEGTIVRAGIWMNLVRVGEDGTPRIHWTVSNGWPAGM